MANLIQCMQILVINQNKILGLNSFARKTFYGGEEKWRWKYFAHSPYFAYFAHFALLALLALLTLHACFVCLFFIFCTFYIFCIFCMFCIFCIFCIVCIFVFFRIFCISYFPRRLFCLDTPMTGSPPHFQGQYVIENDYSWSHLVVTYTEGGAYFSVVSGRKSNLTTVLRPCRPLVCCWMVFFPTLCHFC